MTKQLLSLATIVIIFVAFFTNLVFASIEKGDTLVIQQADQQNTPFNEIIAADTLADGSRKHLVYELEPNGWYPLSATLTAATYDLAIVGGKRNSDQTRPVILVKNDFSGWYMMSGGKNITIKGVHWMQIVETIGGNISPWSRGGVELTGVNSKVVFHDNIWDFNAAFAFFGGKDGLNLKVSNCLFRFNKSLDNAAWVGQGFDIREAALDTVIMKNCTWYGGGPFLNITWESTQNLFRMDHCTVVDWVQFPIHSVHYNNAEFTNMLFYNAHTMGEDSAQIKGQDPDGLPYGILNIDTLYLGSDGKIDKAKEATRRMVVKNNNNFIKQNIKDYWAVATSDPQKYHFFTVADPSFYDGFMNSRTKAMFADDATWPDLILENTTSLNPEFVNYFDYSDTLINYSKYFYRYAWPGAKPTKFMLDPDGNPLKPTDPMIYNLKINNATLRTASTTGGPIGDLTWELTNGYNSTQAEINTTPVKINSTVKKIDGFALKQNYPNPFNPSTKIHFTIGKKSTVTLTIFNSLGQEVATLVNKKLTAGPYEYSFEGSHLTSGIYFYRLEADNFLQQKKMLLIK